MGDKVLKSVFLSLMILLSLCVGIASLNDVDYNNSNSPIVLKVVCSAVF